MHVLVIIDTLTLKYDYNCQLLDALHSLMVVCIIVQTWIAFCYPSIRPIEVSPLSHFVHMAVLSRYFELCILWPYQHRKTDICGFLNPTKISIFIFSPSFAHSTSASTRCPKGCSPNHSTFLSKSPAVSPLHPPLSPSCVVDSTIRRSSRTSACAIPISVFTCFCVTEDWREVRSAVRWVIWDWVCGAMLGRAAGAEGGGVGIEGPGVEIKLWWRGIGGSFGSEDLTSREWIDGQGAGRDGKEHFGATTVPAEAEGLANRGDGRVGSGHFEVAKGADAGSAAVEWYPSVDAGKVGFSTAKQVRWID